MKIYQSALISRKLPCPEKFLVTRLLAVPACRYKKVMESCDGTRTRMNEYENLIYAHSCMLTFIVSDTHKWIMLPCRWYNQHDETLILDPCCHQQAATSTAITLNHFLKKAVLTVSCKKRISSKASLQRILSLNTVCSSTLQRLHYFTGIF